MIAPEESSFPTTVYLSRRMQWSTDSVKSHSSGKSIDWFFTIYTSVAQLHLYPL